MFLGLHAGFLGPYDKAAHSIQGSIVTVVDIAEKSQALFVKLPLWTRRLFSISNEMFLVLEEGLLHA